MLNDYDIKRCTMNIFCNNSSAINISNNPTPEFKGSRCHDTTSQD